MPNYWSGHGPVQKSPYLPKKTRPTVTQPARRGGLTDAQAARRSAAVNAQRQRDALAAKNAAAAKAAAAQRDLFAEREKTSFVPTQVQAEVGEDFTAIAERLGVPEDAFVKANELDTTIKAGAVYNVPDTPLSAITGSQEYQPVTGDELAPRQDNKNLDYDLYPEMGQYPQELADWYGIENQMGFGSQDVPLQMTGDELARQVMEGPELAQMTSLGLKTTVGMGTGIGKIAPGGSGLPPGMSLLDGLSWISADQYDRVSPEDISWDNIKNSPDVMSRLGERPHLKESVAEWLTEFSADGKPITVKDGELVGNVDWDAVLAADPDALQRLEDFGYIEPLGGGAYRPKYYGGGSGGQSYIPQPYGPSFGGIGQKPDYRRNEAYLGLTSWSI